MDFLNQAAGQLRELMLSMTPAARVTAVLLLGVIGVSLGYLVQHQAASPDGFLFNGQFLPGDVVDRAEAAIASAGLEGYERVGNRIKVPSGRKSEFLGAIASAGALPPNFHTVMEKALDQSPFASGDTRRGMFKAAREKQLSMLVSQMDGIEHANVMFDVREAKGLARKGVATATVSVRPSTGEPLSARQVRMIQKAVAGGVAELRPDNVVVTNSGDGVSFGSSGDISEDSFDNEYYRTKLAFESKMKSNIEELLHNVPGVRVQVMAELEATLERTTQTMTPEEQVAAFRTSSVTETDKVSELENGGRPGLDAQGPGRNQTAESSVTVKNDRQVESNEAENLVGSSTEMTRAAALVPKSVRAAIAVPTNYLLSVWREQQRRQGNDPEASTPTEAELATIESLTTTNIKHIVVKLLPNELGKDEVSDVEVRFFDSLTPDPVEGPSMASNILGWASQNFNTMTMAVVALVSLMMLRSMVKSIPNAEPAMALAGPTLALDTTEGDAAAPADGEEGETDDGQRPRLRLKKGDSLKDDLVEIVREDPDAAAAILRSWIGNAG